MPDVPTSRILVVDDREENLLAVKAVLQPLHKEIVYARSGVDALGWLLREEFAVVLLDVEMPVMDGIETAELIRSRPRHQHLPIIFVTAHNSDMQRVLRGYELGAIDFLAKPLVPEILRAKVGFFVELYERGQLIRSQERELLERRQAEEEARRAAVLEKQLVGIVGHDIRSPLSAILATAQVQLRKGNDLKDDQRRAFERIERSTQRIRQIVELLLDFTRARVGRGIQLQKAAVCLAELCHRIVDETTAVHPGRQIVLDGAEQPLVGHWDGGRLSQVVANLLDNAVKYSPPHSPVRVTLRRSGESAVLEVTNGGAPIPAEKMAQLFEPYVRGDGDAQNRAGLGLGLFIIRQIVRGHGGEVEVVSDEQGTTFRAILPRGSVPVEEVTPAAAAR